MDEKQGTPTYYHININILTHIRYSVTYLLFLYYFFIILSYFGY
jgi:hypothetical protein